MMRRGCYSGNKKRQYICRKCGAKPPWNAAKSHERKCTTTQNRRHREDRT